MSKSETKEGLFVLVISGSTQESGQSLKVAEYFKLCLSKLGVENHLLDLHALDLPFFGLHLKDDAWQQRWQKEEVYFKKADGVVLVSPEYNGSASSAIFNLMVYVGDSLAHKPVLPVGVSGGRGGAYPLANLRQNGFKDPAYNLIPGSVIVSHVNGVLNDQSFAGQDSRLNEEENELRLNIDRNLQMLLAYAKALKGLNLLFKN